MTDRWLEAVFIADKSTRRLGFTGCRCVLPDGRIVENEKRRVPFFDLARQLQELGYGDWMLRVFTPAGTPSLKGRVSVLAQLTIEESDRDGLTRRKYRPFRHGGESAESDRRLPPSLRRRKPTPSQ